MTGLFTHRENLVALTYALELDTRIVSQLLWAMHAECITVFPEGIKYLPWVMAGSAQIAAATERAFETRGLVLWQYHGIFGCGADLDEAFGAIHTAEKTACIYKSACAMGGVKQKLSLEKLYSIACNFGFESAEDL